MRFRQKWLIFFVFWIYGFLPAVEPQKWELKRFEDFLRGQLQSLRLSADGWLSLSLKADIISGPNEEFYLAAVMASDGTLYIGTGHNGRIYRLRNGKSELYFQSSEMDVTCLALDAKGVLYAGTSPAGKIYRITGVGQGETFFDPEEKYIWDLVLTEKGTLLAAVGERGGLYEISPLGEGKLIFRPEETHLLCLERLASGEIYAGSGSLGRLYLIKPGGKVSLLFDSGYEEIKDLVADNSGFIYIAASGTPKVKREEAGKPTIKSSSTSDFSVTVVASEENRPSLSLVSSEGREPGAVFLVKADGVARKLWSSSEEMVYSLLFNPIDKKIYFGTGNKGRIYCLEGEVEASLIYEGKFEQVYALQLATNRILFLGNNPCSLGFLSREQALEGEFLSSIIEAPTVATWGKLEWLAQMPPGTALVFQSRSGNSLPPGATWSEWSPPYQKSGETILSPKGKYLQLRVLFRSPAGNVSPTLQRVTLFFLPANLPPLISRLEILEPNEVFLKPPEQDEIIWGLESKRKTEKSGPEEGRLTTLAARKVIRKGYQTFRWEANDDNGDSLIYSIYLRREGEKEWHLLADDWMETVLVIETETFPEGRYELKVVASDRPSNPPLMELKTEKISLPFVIDNSAPQIKNVTATEKNNQLELSFEVEDSFSAIKKAEILIRPGLWQVVFPIDGLCDSPKENFQLKLILKPGSERLAIIRVEDRAGNRAVFWQKF
ncbi:MAG: WD40 repeat domain-containing protein [Candidatus Aminicenantes bacterium]|nr:WD40 repeat domain-containing protein [Candidatus Aminicenantes bacterium]